METSSLALDWITSEQIFAMLLCLFLAYIAYKMNSWSFTMISSFAWLAVGAQIYGATEDGLLFLLIFAVACGQGFLLLYKERASR